MTGMGAGSNYGFVGDEIRRPCRLSRGQSVHSSFSKGYFTARSEMVVLFIQQC